MTITTHQVTVTTTPSLIGIVPSGDSFITVSVTSDSSTPVVLGTSAKVRTSNGSFPNFTAGGFPVPVGRARTFINTSIQSPTAIWGVCTAGTSTLSYFVSTNA